MEDGSAQHWRHARRDVCGMKVTSCVVRLYSGVLEWFRLDPYDLLHIVSRAVLLLLLVRKTTLDEQILA